MTKVLIVHDDPPILTIANMRLRAEAVGILTAGDGPEGLLLAREYRPAGVVLDWMLPQVHGFAVLQQIRGDPALRQIRILVTSAQGYAADGERVRQRGADRVLRKPYDSQEFRKAVSELVGERKGRLAVRFGGRQRSIATPGPPTVKYGGKTACSQERCGQPLLSLDAGTGIRSWGFP